MHLSRSGRVIALLLAFLASFSAPGASIAHDTAHHREQRGAHEQQTSQSHGAHDHQHGHSHHGHGTAAAVLDTDRPGAGTAFGGRAVSSHGEPGGSHGHPTLDLPGRPRVALAVIPPIVAVGALIAAPEIEVTGGTPIPHAALPRADPDAVPRPRTRAPPLR